MKKLYNNGDTIIEVLIAITIISSVLGVAYKTMNRASQNARQAQERGVATKLLESQAERLKSPPTGINFHGGDDAFCINSSSQKKDISAGFTPPPLETDPLTVYATKGCAFDETGSAYTTSGVQYNIAIVRSGNNFTIYCRWEGLGTQGNEQASISYRVHP